MAQNYGLGRGLSSLIPQRRKPFETDTDEKMKASEEDHDYFGVIKKASSPGFSSVAQAIAEKKSSSPTRLAEDTAKQLGGEVKTAGGENVNANTVLEADISKIIPNPHQPRVKFDESRLQELAASIRANGIIQPLIVSKKGLDYELIAGERRLQAAKLAGLKNVPVILRLATEQQKLELAIIENVQRHDLNPIEEAAACKRLMEEFDLNQEEVGIKLGKSRPAVANKLRLLTLPVEIQKALVENKISEGHAKAILAIENPEKQRALFEMIIKNNLTVRQTEDKTKEVSVRTHKRMVNIDPETKAIEDDLSQSLGTKVKLSKSGSGGKIVIEYYSKEELENILSKIKK